MFAWFLEMHLSGYFPGAQRVSNSFRSNIIIPEKIRQTFLRIWIKHFQEPVFPLNSKHEIRQAERLNSEGVDFWFPKSLGKHFDRSEQNISR